MNIKLGPGFYFIEDEYQDNDRCHAVNPRWPTLIDRTLFSASVNKNAILRYRKDFFHNEIKGSTFLCMMFKRRNYKTVFLIDSL